MLEARMKMSRLSKTILDILLDGELSDQLLHATIAGQPKPFCARSKIAEQPNRNIPNHRGWMPLPSGWKLPFSRIAHSAVREQHDRRIEA
jgi:hypothetical protein